MWPLLLFTTVSSIRLAANFDEKAPSQKDLYSSKSAEKFFDPELEDLCKNLFSREFGYTLVGEEKPISTGAVCREYPYEISEKCITALKKMFERSPNFVLKVFSYGSLYFIELINRKSLRDLVNKNNIVRSFVKKEFDGEADFYSKVEDLRQKLHIILKKNEKITGYLLGYSKDNINYYLRRFEVGTFLQKYPLVLFHPLPGGRYSNSCCVFMNRRLVYVPVKPSSGFASLEAEWQWIKDIEWDIREESKPIPPYFVFLPFYICRHGGDSEMTRERYKKASHQIAEVFYNKSFQEAVAEIAASS
jgi:hypothetical protein